MMGRWEGEEIQGRGDRKGKEMLGGK